MPTLLELLQYYEARLCDRKFRYHLTNHTCIEICFFRESLCHLLGIQHVIRSRDFLGKRGFTKILNEELTETHLKKINVKGYAYIRQRIRYFDQIHEVLERGDLFRFYLERVHPPSQIHADFLLYKEYIRLYLHLFLAQEQFQKEIYTPISYIPLTEKDKSPARYHANQEYKRVESLEIIPMKSSSKN